MNIEKPRRYSASFREYLKEQLKDPVFALEFEKATKELDLLIASWQEKPDNTEEETAQINGNAG